MTFAIGDRVILTGPPEDIARAQLAAGYDRGAGLFAGQTGVITAPSYDDQFVVHLDVDLHKAGKFGWIVNDYAIPKDNLRYPESLVTEDEVKAALDSIRTTVQKHTESR